MVLMYWYEYDVELQLQHHFFFLYRGSHVLLYSCKFLSSSQWNSSFIPKKEEEEEEERIGCWIVCLVMYLIVVYRFLLCLGCSLIHVNRMGSVEREIESHDRFFYFIFLDRKRNFIRREEKIIEEKKRL